MPNCAFLTIENTEGWFIDDDLAHGPLGGLGWSIQNVPWTIKKNWNEYDIVVLRSTWDYQSNIPQFINVLEEIETSSAVLFNSLQTVRWNIDKSYLLELQDRGIRIVPTATFENLEEKAILEAFEHFDVNEIIVKPIVGANADDTFRIKRSSDKTLIQSITKTFQSKQGFLQPFIQSVIQEGEFSVIFINGHISHVVLKTVGQGDFRVQEEHGGGVTAIQSPAQELISASQKVIQNVPFDTLYARVDLVRLPSNEFALMELELVEPALYFRFDAQSAERFAHAINKRFLSLAK